MHTNAIRQGNVFGKSFASIWLFGRTLQPVRYDFDIALLYSVLEYCSGRHNFIDVTEDIKGSIGCVIFFSSDIRIWSDWARLEVNVNHTTIPYTIYYIHVKIRSFILFSLINLLSFCGSYGSKPKSRETIHKRMVYQIHFSSWPFVWNSVPTLRLFPFTRFIKVFAVLIILLWIGLLQY